MSNNPIRPARDWRKLVSEAKAGGYVTTRMIAIFVADNTTDRRSEGPPGSYKFAEGYHTMIETWLQQEALS